MAILGNNATQATAAGSSRGDLHVFGPYTAASTGSPITQLSLLLDGLLVSGESTEIVLVCYAENGNTPVGGALVAQTAINTVAVSDPKAYRDISLSSGSITSGSKYWVGFLVSNATGVNSSMDFYYDNPGSTPVNQCTKSSQAWNSGTAPATFPSTTAPSGAFSFACYAVYTVAATVTPNTASSSRAQTILLTNDML